MQLRNAAFKSRNQQAYQQAQKDLRRGISEAKSKYKQCIEEHFNSNDTRSMWQGIIILTSYNNTNADIGTVDPAPSDILNNFFARFDHQTSEDWSLSASNQQDPPIQFQPHQVKAVLRRVNVRKAVGPDGVTWRILKDCADQLSEVFTTIFNLSFRQSVVPACLKSATIIPVPKKAQ